MRKVFLIAAAACMLIFASPACADGTSSPVAQKITEEAGKQSPKTGDMNILWIEGVGAAALAAAIGAYKHSRRMSDEA